MRDPRFPLNPCSLALEDGTVFSGYSFGARRPAAGEVVFNTAMTGYPESLTDPSYRGQILVLTYPLVGNYGAPDHPGQPDEFGLSGSGESHRIHVAGLAAAHYSHGYSHWNACKSLSQWLGEHDVPGIYGIDTRALTQKIRENGAMKGKILPGDSDIPFDNPNDRNLAAEVSASEKTTRGAGKYHILLVDCGVKHSILKRLLALNATVTQVPWDYDFSAERCDGIFLSNGPGNPAHNEAAVKHLLQAFNNDIPIFGICMGHQLMGLAAGANTYKMKYGHRGHNQPVRLLNSPRVFITSQNHGYAVDETGLGPDWEPLYRNMNDGTCEGLIHRSKPFFSVQFHPEACGGPADTGFLFNHFMNVAAGKTYFRNIPLSPADPPDIPRLISPPCHYCHYRRS